MLKTERIKCFEVFENFDIFTITLIVKPKIICMLNYSIKLY